MKVKRIGIVAGIILAVCLVGVLGLACAQSKVGIYSDTAVVKATGPEDDIRLKNAGTDKTIEITLEETAGVGAMITSVDWRIYDATRDMIAHGSAEWAPPKEIEAEGTATISFDISYYGGKTGPFFLEYTVSGYNTKNGNDISSIPGYSSVDIIS